MSKEIENTVNVSLDKIMETYRGCDERGKSLLREVFGDTIAPITDRVTCFDDALYALGMKHPLVDEYRRVNDIRRVTDGAFSVSFVYYQQLRIITAALNEGWTPKPSGELHYWYPVFRLVSPTDFANMDSEQRSLVAALAESGGFSEGGVFYSYAGYTVPNEIAPLSIDLMFKTEELAEYAGKQFTSLYAHYIFG